MANLQESTITESVENSLENLTLRDVSSRNEITNSSSNNFPVINPEDSVKTSDWSPTNPDNQVQDPGGKGDNFEQESVLKADSQTVKSDPICSGGAEQCNIEAEKGTTDYEECVDDITKCDTNNTEEDLIKGDNPSDSSETEEEYESAEEGDERIEVDEENLKVLEESMSEEEKEERRKSALELKSEGNILFKDGSFKSAIKCYTRALHTCPLKYIKDRAIMYSNRAACKLRLEYKEEAIRDCTKAVELHPHYIKAFMRRAELYEATDKLDDALTDYQKIVELDPSQHVARMACMRLPDQIKERNEKLKEEMMGKLKDLGNLILNPFGLSTDNFQLNKDPNSGGYSVAFQQNPSQKQ